MGNCPLPCLLEGILHSSGTVGLFILQPYCHLHLSLLYKQINMNHIYSLYIYICDYIYIYVYVYIYIYMCVFANHTCTHINDHIQLWDALKPPISIGVLFRSKRHSVHLNC